ncbi:hypothetical protein GCM10020331_096060 [Ectobacillus funiculus]
MEMGYASALAWILLIIIGIVTAIIFFASSRYWVFYAEGGRKRMKGYLKNRTDMETYIINYFF